ncbi:AAA family ATPase [Mycolicibacterium boenickei]
MIIVITGAMASGKSTVAQLLAERFERSAHVRGDVFRRFVVGGRAEPAEQMSADAQAQLVLRYRLGAASADAYAAAGFVTIWQDVIIGPYLADAVDMLQTRPVFVVVLDPAPEVIAEREHARAKVGYGTDWDHGKFVETMRSTTPRLGLWLDTSAMSPEQAVQAVLDGLDRAEIPVRNTTITS